MIKIVIALFALTLLPIHSAFSSPIPAEKLFQEPTIGLTDISPDGKYVSYMANRQNKQYLAIQDTRDLSIQGVLLIDSDQRLLGYNWLDADTLLVNVHFGKRDRLVVVYRDKTSETTKWKNRVLQKAGYLVSNSLEDESEVLLALDSDQEGANYDLYRLPITELTMGAVTSRYRIEEKQSGIRIFAYSEELKRLLVMTIDDEAEALNIEFRNLYSGNVEHSFTLGSSAFDFVPVGFFSESKMAVLSNKDVNTWSLYEFDLETNTLGKLLYKHEKYDLNDAEVSPVTGKVVSVNYFDHGRLTTEYFNTTDQNLDLFLQKQLPDKQFTIAAQNTESQKKVIYAFASNDPGQYYLFNEKTKKLTPLLSRLPQLEGTELMSNQRIKTTSQDGTEIEAYLTLPIGIDHQTLLVMPHGGPIGIREYDEFDPTVQYFASRGFTILRVNFRGSSGFGKSFQDSGVGQFGQLIEEDISAAVEHIEKQYKFKSKCAMGASYGGYSSMILAIKHPQKYDCAIGAFGIYDLPLLFNSSNFDALEEVRQATENVVGKESDELYELSPVYLAEKINVPVLLIAGLQDKVAPPEHTFRMEMALKKFNKNVQTVYYQSSSHGHPTWVGDWHEVALTYQFLLDSLGLPDLKVEQIAKGDLPLIRNEFQRIGYSFDAAQGVAEDQNRAFKFYTAAQKLGSARANTRLAWYYEDGILREQDSAKALELYKAGSDMGDDLAAYMLGKAYFDGDWVKKDSTQALQYLELAIGRGFNSMASAMAAYYYCLGESVPVDEKKCIDMLDLNSIKKDKKRNLEVDRESISVQQMILAKLLLSENLKDSVRAKLIYAISSWYKIDTFDFEVDKEDYGIMYRDGFKYEFSGESNIDLSTRTPNQKLGVRFEMDFDPKSRGGDTLLLVNWETVNKQGVVSPFYEEILKAKEDELLSHYIFLDEIDNEVAEVRFRIFNAENKPLLTHTFSITH